MLEIAVKATGRVIVAGGDGTVHALLKAAGGCHSLEMGIIPAGTSNHLAAALGIPQDIDAAIDVIASGHLKPIDLGKVNETFFSEAAGAGLHAKVFRNYGEHKEKSARDAASAVMAALSDWEPQLMRVIIDGDPYLEELTQITAANTPSYGARFTIAPDARVDDGLLDIVMVGSLSKIEIVEYGLAAMSGRLSSMPKTHTTRARKIEIAAVGDDPIEVHADAEPVGYTPAVIEVLPGCVQVIVPKEST
jgi:diacylglycerol kinase (ATP)